MKIHGNERYPKEKNKATNASNARMKIKIVILKRKHVHKEFKKIYEAETLRIAGEKSIIPEGKKTIWRHPTNQSEIRLYLFYLFHFLGIGGFYN